ncbi:hypothetical protein LOCC1_G008401 [Lachnellula occidentalis]|uniref:Globin-sensor domain-containing protein n=1 Tax=Lachnellula occidentalis TaxID=215460 RepID=A0A8H8RDR3_9HELO|nr:hypothetical protein LOCC1_G008401 [Lachnellula occidentalis]
MRQAPASTPASNPPPTSNSARPMERMKHISREELYTDLEARIRYLHDFLDFSGNEQKPKNGKKKEEKKMKMKNRLTFSPTGDIDALVSGAKYVKTLIPAVVNIVYKKLLQYDITARAFTTRSTSFEGPLDEVLEENSPQILHRKMFMKAYLTKLCSDPSKMEFWEYLDKVGMMHVGLGRAHPLHVEYIHLGVCLSFIQDILTEAILSHPRLHLSRKIALVKALGKVIWIQNDLFAKWQMRDGAEFTGSEEVVIEKEGYLHGKKVLDDVDGDVGQEMKTEMEAGACPFSGMADLKLKVDEPKLDEPKVEADNPALKT